MAASKQSQKDCHSSGSPVKTGMSSFDRRVVECPPCGASVCCVGSRGWDEDVVVDR